MSDELDLILLSSLYLGPWTFEGDEKTVGSNELIMKGYGWNFCNIGKVRVESDEYDCV